MSHLFNGTKRTNEQKEKPRRLDRSDVTPAAVTIPTQRGDNGRSGTTPSETTLTLQNVNSNTFGLLFERPVEGDMYPQPLIVSGLNIGGGSHNVVYVATAANNVYAYEAD